MSNANILTRAAQVGDGLLAMLSRLVGVPQRGTLLASAARSATTATSQVDAYGWRTMLVFWNITSVGTGSLFLSWDYLDPVTGNWLSASAQTVALTTTGLRVFAFGAGCHGTTGFTNAGQGTNLPLTSAVRLRVAHSDGSSWTYSLGYELA